MWSLHDGLRPGAQKIIGLKLTTEPQPVLIGDLAKAADVSQARISQLRVDIDNYLAESLAENPFLSTAGLRVRIPGSGKSDDTRFGYYFAFFDVERQRFLTSQEAKRARKRNYFDRVRSLLRDQLREDASESLSARLDDRKDYQPLDLEVGILEKIPLGEVTDEDAMDKAMTQSNHRTWKPMNCSALLNLKGQHILVAETGMGKTTLLRWLQSELLEEDSRLPIFLDAAEIERWTYRSWRSFFKKVAKWLELEVKREWVVGFLEEQADDSIVLLVDGLDQIRGVGTEYELFLRNLLRACKKRHMTALVASRPSAVVDVENNRDVSLIRLKPFRQAARRAYFGRHYDRAGRLCQQDRDMMGVPMLAYMIRQLIRTGRDSDINTRAALYEQFIEYILYERKPQERAFSLDEREAARELLQKIAFEALSRQEPYIQTIPLGFWRQFTPYKGLTIDRLLKLGLTTLVADRSRGTDRSLFFTHQSFQEYLAARELATKPNHLEVALTRVYHPAWSQVLTMLGGVVENPRSYVAALLHADRDDPFCRPFLLAIAAICEVKPGQLTSAFLESLSRQLAEICLQRAFGFLSGDIVGARRAPPGVGEELICIVRNGQAGERKQAVAALGAMQYEPATPFLGHAAKTDQETPVRYAAVRSLSTIGSVRALPDLIHVAGEDPCMSVRCGAAEALGEIGGSEATLGLTAMLGAEQDPRPRCSAVEALGAIGGKVAVSELNRVVTEDRDGDVRVAAAQALRRAGSMGAVRVLARVLKKDPDWAVRCAAVRALGTIGSKTSGRVLTRLLKQEQFSPLRQLAAEALGAIRDVRTVPALTRAVEEDCSGRVRYAAARAWIELDRRRAIPALVRLLSRGQGGMERWAAAEALGACGCKEAIPALLGALKRGQDCGLRCLAARALGAIGSRRSVPGLIEALQDERLYSAHLFVVEALGAIGCREAIPSLLQRAEDGKNGELASAAIRALGAIGSEDAVPTLAEVLKLNRDRWRRCHAAEALGRIGGIGSTTALSEVLGDCRDSYVREEVGKALATIGDEKAVPALIRALRDGPDDFARPAVRDALRAICMGKGVCTTGYDWPGENEADLDLFAELTDRLAALCEGVQHD